MRISELDNQNLYRNLSASSRMRFSALEVPSAVANTVRRLHSSNEIGADRAQNLLAQATNLVDNTFLKVSPKIESFLGRGYESSAYSFNAGGRKWAVKFGTQESFTSGMLSPSTEEYANKLRWDYSVLQDIVGSKLPHILPAPFFVLSPNTTGHPATIQIVPFIERSSGLERFTNEQVARLVYERITFDSLSNELRETRKVLPDLFYWDNLVIGVVNNEPHFVLIDLGLINLFAPTPVLNLLAPSAQIISFKKDMIMLRRRKKLR